MRRSTANEYVAGHIAERSQSRAYASAKRRRSRTPLECSRASALCGITMPLCADAVKLWQPQRTQDVQSCAPTLNPCAPPHATRRSPPVPRRHPRSTSVPSRCMPEGWRLQPRSCELIPLDPSAPRNDPSARIVAGLFLSRLKYTTCPGSNRPCSINTRTAAVASYAWSRIFRILRHQSPEAEYRRTVVSRLGYTSCSFSMPI